MATSSKAKKKTVRIASGLKRVRQDVKLNAANTALRSKFRTVIKNVQKAVIAGDKADHLRANRQDKVSARVWERARSKVSTVAAAVLEMEV